MLMQKKDYDMQKSHVETHGSVGYSQWVLLQLHPYLNPAQNWMMKFAFFFSLCWLQAGFITPNFRS